MAYLIFTVNGDETSRRELTGPTTIGRAADCDINIHDIILSRHHCRIEPEDEKWIIADLHSKNGTFLHGRQIERGELRDGSELQVGRTRVTFKVGAFVPSVRPVAPRSTIMRPVDPAEALAGTVTGMVLCEPGEVEHQPNQPRPQPRPRDPSSYQSDDVYGMINEIVSSSWDSIMAQNSQPIRMQRAMPAPAMTKANRGAIRPKARVAFCLQAEHVEQPAGIVAHAHDVAAPLVAKRPRRWRWLVAAGVALTLLSVSLLLHGDDVRLHNANSDGATRVVNVDML